MENRNTADLLKALGFRFNKALGQNFIFDTNLLDAVVADSGVSADDTVVEIGTGAGTLTARIADKCRKVFSFEVDEKLKPVLSLSLQGIDNVEVVFRDVLKMSDDAFRALVGDGKFKVIANLPYYVTTPLIMRFIESGLDVESLTVMVQKEVADRICAAPATEDYSALTLAVEVFGTATLTRKVSRTVFRPSPNVDSAVVRIERERNKLQGKDIRLVKRLIRAAFAMRRKTLANNLQSAFGMPKDEATALICEAGFAPTVRGEVLSLDDFVKLSVLMKQKRGD